MAVKCLGQSLDAVLKRLKKVEDRKNIKEESNYNSKVDEELEYEEYRDNGPFDEVLKKSES